MQDWQEQDGQGGDGLFGRWRVRLAQALLREPSVVLIDRDADVVAVDAADLNGSAARSPERIN